MGGMYLSLHMWAAFFVPRFSGYRVCVLLVDVMGGDACLLLGTPACCLWLVLYFCALALRTVAWPLVCRGIALRLPPPPGCQRLCP